MPIPPNRECIESVDMVLHIPIAVDYFYDYLMNRPTEEQIHWFALYIDLRMYDNACSSESTYAEKLEIATTIYDQYFKENAKYFVVLDQQVWRKFASKFN